MPRLIKRLLPDQPSKVALEGLLLLLAPLSGDSDGPPALTQRPLAMEHVRAAAADVARLCECRAC